MDEPPRGTTAPRAKTPVIESLFCPAVCKLYAHPKTSRRQSKERGAGKGTCKKLQCNKKSAAFQFFVGYCPCLF